MLLVPSSLTLFSFAIRRTAGVAITLAFKPSSDSSLELAILLPLIPLLSLLDLETASENR